MKNTVQMALNFEEAGTLNSYLNKGWRVIFLVSNTIAVTDGMTRREYNGGFLAIIEKENETPIS